LQTCQSDQLLEISGTDQWGVVVEVDGGGSCSEAGALRVFHPYRPGDHT